MVDKGREVGCRVAAAAEPRAVLRHWLGMRALARSISAEMHAGFAALRAGMPMNLHAQPPRPGRSDAITADIERITAIWRDCRARCSDGGPFLPGTFSAADAMYAPVATRFRTYGVRLDAIRQAYADALLALHPFPEWEAAAQQEPWTITRYSNSAAAASIP